MDSGVNDCQPSARQAHRQHVQTQEALYRLLQDVMLEVMCRTYQEKILSVSDVNGLIDQQLANLQD